MDKKELFRKRWADQLRAGALEVAAHADDIIGNLENNVSLTVSINLETNKDEIVWPKLTIERTIFSNAMIKKMMEQYNEPEDKQRNPYDDILEHLEKMKEGKGNYDSQTI